MAADVVLLEGQGCNIVSGGSAPSHRFASAGGSQTSAWCQGQVQRELDWDELLLRRRPSAAVNLTNRSLEASAARSLAAASAKGIEAIECTGMTDRKGAIAPAGDCVSGCTYADLYRLHGFSAIQVDHLQFVAGRG